MHKRLLITTLLATTVALPAAADRILGLTGTNAIVLFDSANPGMTGDLRTVTGLGVGETLIGIDERPADGRLYALSNNGGAGRLYSISLAGGNAVATAIGAPGGIVLSGTSFGFDFNPLPDRIRLVSNTGQNVRLNPNTGTQVDSNPMLPGIQGDGTLKYDDTVADGDPIDINAGVTPTITAAAYTNSFGPSPRNAVGMPNPNPALPTGPGTTLFVLDANLDIIAIQSPPNDGILNTVGTAGPVQDPTGFDISGVTGQAFASFFSTGLGGDAFFTMNLAGGVQSVSMIGNGMLGITDIAVVTGAVPAPATLALFGLGIAGLAVARRRA